MNEIAIVAYIANALVTAFENNKTDVVVRTAIGACKITNIHYEYLSSTDKNVFGFVKADNDFIFPSGNTISLCMVYGNKRIVDAFTGLKLGGV